MLPDLVSNPGPLTYELGALPIALRGPTRGRGTLSKAKTNNCQNSTVTLKIILISTMTSTSMHRCKFNAKNLFFFIQAICHNRSCKAKTGDLDNFFMLPKGLRETY